ncbi:MAG TPA: histidine kinase N-terminal 7TM domain-containing protein [Armatimonadota bacterium]|nr:histidine kinase N-terminal 7TM domain-containing protein [Armatimonadota bacterium]
MSWHFHPWYQIPLLACGVFAIVTALCARRFGNAPGARYAGLVMWASALWSLAGVGAFAVDGIPGKLFWVGVAYVGLSAVMPLVFLLILDYLGFTRWLTTKRILLICLIPAITVLLNWTNHWHHLIYRQVSIVRVGDTTLLAFTYGPWVFLSVVYVYLLTVVGIIAVVGMGISAASVYRKQFAILIVGTVLPLITSLIYATRTGPIPNLDLTPLAYSAFGAAVLWGVVKYQFWQLTPVAHSTILDTLPEGIIVLNADCRIVEANHLAEQLFGLSGDALIGHNWAEVAPGWLPHNIMTIPSAAQANTRYVCADDNAPTYSLTITELAPGSRHDGWLLVLRDVTMEQLMIEEEERKKIALFVHDEIGQSISASLLHLTKAQRQLGDSLVRTSCETVAGILETTLNRTRALTTGLSFPTFLDAGLLPALEWLAKNMSDTFPIAIQVKAPDALPDLSIPRRRLLFRITRELLFNVIKHAHAQMVLLTVECPDTTLRITVCDDGKGFDLEQVSHCESGGFGLQSIQEQLWREQGTFHISSTHDVGTSVVITLPTGAQSQKVEVIPCQ